MKVDIKHVEKSQGLIFKTKFYGVAVTVVFNEEEKQIIKSSGIGRQIILERGIPVDVDAEKHANRGLASKLLTAAIKGADANNFHLTIGKLLNGTDTYFLPTIVDAKSYEVELREGLVELKEYITHSAAIEEKSASFEL